MSNTNQDKIYQTTTRRLYVILALVVFSSVILIANFFQLMVIEAKPDAYKDPQSPQTERGPILDRNGKILAIQQRLHTVTAWTPSVSHKEETASLLAEILNTEKEILLKKFQSEEGFLFIQRAIEPSQSEEIAKLQEEGKLEGIYLQEGLGRRYPENELASHVIGYVGIDNKGLDGIEYRYDDVLTSSPGEHQGNNFGSQVILTIDSNIQHFTDTLSQELLAEHEASGIIMLVMDSYTGEILAYTSAPAFNPNKFQEYTQEERRNIPVSYLYEPGSVFKIFSISSFLELGAISQSQLFDASVAYERFQDGRSLFRISDLGSYGMINAADIIRYSSNVGAAHASDYVSNEQMYHMIRQFGFGEKTGIDVNGEQRGILRPPESWSARTKPTIAIGQEIAVSAIQLISAATVFTNQGVLIKPQIIRQIVGPDGNTIQSFAREPVRQVLSPGIADSMLEMMSAATQDGTGRRAKTEGVSIAAKTGTAQMLDPETGKYSETAFIASTIGIFPAERPRIIAYTAIIHPKSGDIYGGRIAAPTINKIAEFLIPYLGIPKSSDIQAVENNSIRIEQSALPPISDKIPDLRGLPKRTIMPLFESAPFKLEISGNGWVTYQNPAPGSPFNEDTVLYLELE